jgi:hypothetical protein
MKKSLFALLAVFFLALSIVPAGIAGEPQVTIDTRWMTPENARNADNGDVVYRCATEERGRPVDVPSQAEIERWISENRIAAGGVIPVHFHVIYKTQRGQTVGYVTEARIDQQLAVMNNNFAGRDYNGNVVSGAANTGYTFVKASVEWINSSKWFGMTPGSKAERDAKNANVVNPTGALNFYTCQPGQNLLGWATFPSSLAGNPNMDGVVIHHASLPGGSLAPYNLGGTATHEVGHWVGLYHTFQGGCGTSDCANSGDYVCDTPAQSTATSGCPEGKDTCAGAGLDPIHNYMDYSYDACYNNFTAGQDARADFMMSTYRPVIGSARLADGGGETGNGRSADAFDMGARKADSGEDVYRCATDERAGRLSAPTKAQVDEWLATNRVAAGGVIPVNFHVIYKTQRGQVIGNVPDSWLDDQIEVLNNNYAGRDYNGNPVAGAANTGYTFVKASTSRLNSSKWFGMTPGSKAERDAKNALVVNPTGSLNFYTCQPGQNLLGWATFPWNLAGNPNMDGVVVHWNSLPGGTLSPYNLGGTGSHEVGHWVGLYHTFQGGCGSDCATTGDLVCDTPAQSTATSGCPAGKNTCSAPGDDPIHNYMDYSTDACYNNFTTGQDARADMMMSAYRPVIGSARTADLAARPNLARGADGGLVGLSARPNPFNPRTKVSFGLRREGTVTLRVYDVQGRLAATLVNGRMAAGNHEVEFNGDRLASGVYMMRLQMPDGVEMTRRITLMK